MRLCAAQKGRQIRMNTNRISPSTLRSCKVSFKLYTKQPRCDKFCTLSDSKESERLNTTIIESGAVFGGSASA